MLTKVELVTGTVVVKSYCPALGDRGQVSSSGDMCCLFKLISPTRYADTGLFFANRRM